MPITQSRYVCFEQGSIVRIQKLALRLRSKNDQIMLLLASLKTVIYGSFELFLI